MRFTICVREAGYLQWQEAKTFILGAVAAELDQRDHVLVRVGSFVNFPAMRRDWMHDPIDADRARIARSEVDFGVFHLAGLPESKLERIAAAVAAHPDVLGSTVVGVEERRVLLHLEHTLGLRYRLVGHDLRVLHISRSLLEDLDEQEQEAQALRSSGLFSSVELEDTGLQDTLFDDVNEGHAFVRRIALAGLVRSPWQSEAVCIWLTTIDPELKEILYAAVERASTATINEQLAQAALSLRRYLERLADALFPARPERFNGMDVDKAKWKNRLRAALQERAGSAEAEIELERLTEWLRIIQRRTDEGVHGHPSSTPDEIAAMIVDVLAFSDDVRAQRPPNTRAPDGPYMNEVIRISRKAVGLD